MAKPICRERSIRAREDHEHYIKKPECDAFVGKDVWAAFKAPSQLTEVVERKMPLSIERGVSAFREAHPEARVVGQFLVADVKRKVTELQFWMRNCVSRKSKTD